MHRVSACRKMSCAGCENLKLVVKLTCTAIRRLSNSAQVRFHHRVFTLRHGPFAARGSNHVPVSCCRYNQYFQPFFQSSVLFVHNLISVFVHRVQAESLWIRDASILILFFAVSLRKPWLSVNQGQELVMIAGADSILCAGRPGRLIAGAP